jgi:hypothetical protein
VATVAAWTTVRCECCRSGCSGSRPLAWLPNHASTWKITPVGSSLTGQAADARASVLRAISEAKTLIDSMCRDVEDAVDSLIPESQ